MIKTKLMAIAKDPVQCNLEIEGKNDRTRNVI